MKLLAYPVGDTTGYRITPAPIRRPWMDDTPGGFANRCLPLLAANQAGWWITTNHRVEATWVGGQGQDRVRVDGPAVSHFGSGVVTFHIPWLLRTPPGWNLAVRGPVNWPMDGALALEGLVESDWSVATFTMNWLLTAPGNTVIWSPGDPVCQLLPARRGEITEWEPEFAELPDGDKEEYQRWVSSRAEFIAALAAHDPDAARQGWQRDYFLAGQRKTRVAEFSDAPRRI